VQSRSTESGEHGVRLRLGLRQPLPAAVARALQAEMNQVMAQPIEGLVAPRDLSLLDDEVVFTLDAIHPGATRLSDLLAGLRAAGTSLGDGLAAALTATAAQLCHKIHLAPGVAGRARVHGACHPGNLILTPAGSVALLGTGLRTVDALVLPPDPGAEIRHTAPENAAQDPADPRSDIYGLGVLFLTLLSGQTPWAEASPADHRAALLSGQLRNPGVSLSDPRPSLVEVLRTAMSPAAGQRYSTALGFGQAISNELKASGRPRADAAILQGMLQNNLPANVPQGALVLGPAAAPRPAPAAPARPNSTLGGWSQVLGGSASSSSAAAPAAAQPRAEPPSEPASGAPVAKISLPLPGQGAASSGAPKIRLPLPPGAPTSDVSPAAAPALSGDLGAFDALYDKDVPNQDAPRSGPRRPTPKASPDPHQSHSPKTTLIVGGALVAALVAVWLLSSDDPAPQVPTSPQVQTPGMVAGAAPQDANTPPPAAPQTPTPPPAPPPSPVIVKTKPPSFLTVFSTPTGATVQMDGGYVGKTPLVLKHTFEDRVYELTLLKEGYRPWKKSLRPDTERKSISAKAILEKN